MTGEGREERDPTLASHATGLWKQRALWTFFREYGTVAGGNLQATVAAETVTKWGRLERKKMAGARGGVADR